jgi:hypothetical protein
MSRQHGPDTAEQVIREEAKRRKARRDKAAKPVPEDYGVGDMIVVEHKGPDGFHVHAVAAVVDVLDFAPIRQWQSSFNLIVRIMLVSRATFEPCVGHLFAVAITTSTWSYDRTWRISKLPMEDFTEEVSMSATASILQDFKGKGEANG